VIYNIIIMHYNHKLRNIEYNHKVEEPQNWEKRLPTIKANNDTLIVPCRHFNSLTPYSPLLFKQKK